MKIEVRSLTKSFGELPVLRKVGLAVEAGELVALLGPSGCGKTTLLRIIAGLEFADGGEVLFDGEDVSDRNVRDRRLGFVFQHYALFRHMTVFENVAFGLRVRSRRDRPPKAEIESRVRELLRLVRLDTQAEHLPSELSGGQRQRVALARALAVEPRVLLLDEPFGSLDAQVRRELRGWLRRLHDELHLTSLFVTHDQEEALELADRVAVMHAGRIIQTGSPEEVYQRPAGSFVYNFLGNVNRLRGSLVGGVLYLGGVAAGSLEGATGAESWAPREGLVTLYVRPHLLEMGAAPAAGLSFRARVGHIHAAGPLVKVELDTPWGDSVSIEVPHERFVAGVVVRGAEVVLGARAEHVFVEAREALAGEIVSGEGAPGVTAMDEAMRAASVAPSGEDAG